MNELKIIEQRNLFGKDFKIYGNIENPLFLAKDVATWIEHSNTSKMLNSVDEDEKVTMICDVTNGYSTSRARNTQECLFLTEDGLYEILMQSRKPIAKAFKREVKIILKQIRTTGGYIPIKNDEPDEVFLARALLVAQKTLSKKDEIIQTQNKIIEEQAPKVEFVKKIEGSYDCINFEQFAKVLTKRGYAIGRNNLLKKLREMKILTSGNMPYQRYMKYFEVVESMKNGCLFCTTLINPKGQIYICNKLI